MRDVFVDTSVFVALVNGRERGHASARRAQRDLRTSATRLFTSNYVFAETYAALLARIGREAAIPWGRAFREARSIDLIRVDEGVEDEAWHILEGHGDKRWSFVDATSFALMGQVGTDEAFTFDRNFAQRGLRMIPGS